MDTPLKRVEKIKNYTGSRNLTALAERLNIDRQAFYDLKKASVKNLSSDLVLAIITTFPEFRLEWLQTGVEPMLSSKPKKKRPESVSPELLELLLREIADLKASMKETLSGDEYERLAKKVDNIFNYDDDEEQTK